MDIEFHYYLTFIAARLLGFSYKQARIIGNAAQYVDENQKRYNIWDGNNVVFYNAISQTFDLTLPQKAREGIYTRFHFSPTFHSNQLDFRTNHETSLSLQLLKLAFEENDAYLIGVALHVFADSYAHQGFSGLKCSHNAFGSVQLYGHTIAGECPDVVNMWWWNPIDKRFINNNERFVKALRDIANCNAIDRLIPIMDYQAAHTRIEAYSDFMQNEFGEAIPIPQFEKWINEATYYHKSKYYCKHNFEDSDWYQFQLAIKKYEAMFNKLMEYKGCCLLI